MKVFISQPMRGRDAEDILSEREAIKTKLSEQLDVSIEIVDSYCPDVEIPSASAPLIYLSRAIAKMSEAHVVVLAPGWEEARGCRIEAECAATYEKIIIDLSNQDLELSL